MRNRLSDAALERFVADADVDGLVECLLAVTPQELAVARTWYRANRKRVGDYYNSVEWNRAHPWGDPANKIAHGVDPVLAAALAGPVSAAKWIDWGWMHYYDDLPQCRRFVDVAIARGRDWCAEFAPAAAAVRLPQRNESVGAPAIYRCVREMVVTHGLPVPDGPTFARGWAATLNWDVAVDDIVADAVRNPTFPDVFHHALAAGTLGLQRMVGAAPQAAAALVARGVVDRARLVAQVVELLPAALPAGTQRVLAGLIGSLAMTPAELPTQWPELRGVIATAHGSLGAALLPFAINAVASVDDLLELSTTLVARAEKKQRRDLAATLTRRDLQARLGTGAAIAGLRALREAAVDDPKLGAQIDAALGAPAPEPAAAPASGLWDLVPPAEQPYAATRIGEFPGLTPDLLQWMPGRQESREDVPDALPELALAAVVREAWANGAAAAWAKLGPMLNAETSSPSSLLQVLRDGHPDSSGLGFLEAVELAGVERRDTTGRYFADPFDLNFAPSSVRYLLAREALARLGRTACLLSTPSHDDLTISFEALVPRLQLNQGATFGPFDLFQTLLRLRPVDPSELDALDGLRLPLDVTVVPAGRACAITDAVDAIREWLQTGGLPCNEPVSAPGQRRPECEPAVLPLGLEQFGVLPRGALDNLRGHHDSVSRLAPRWLDARDTSLQHRFLGTEEPPGRHAYGRLVTALSHEDDERRSQAGRIVLVLIARGQLDTALLISVAAERAADGHLSLTRLTYGLDVLASSGGLRIVWPAALELARHGCAGQRRSTGLDRLLGLLAHLAPEVPDPGLPDEITRFARQPGSTQSHLRARELVARVDAAARAVA